MASINKKIPSYAEIDKHTLVSIEDLKEGDMVSFTPFSSNVQKIGKIMIDKETDTLVVVDTSDNRIYPSLDSVTSKL